MINSVDPDQTAPIGSYLGPSCLLLYINLSVMLGNYLHQTTSADVFFQMHFFLALEGLKDAYRQISWKMLSWKFIQSPNEYGL